VKAREEEEEEEEEEEYLSSTIYKVFSEGSKVKSIMFRTPVLDPLLSLFLIYRTNPNS
jgi:hypothetical protein